MNYLFALADDDAAQAWWESVARNGSIAPSGQIRAHQATETTSHMVVDTGSTLLCCIKGRGVDLDAPTLGPAHWRVGVEDVEAGVARVRATSPGGVTVEIRCAAELVDDLVWYDPKGDLPIRLIRALSESELLRTIPNWPAELAAALGSNTALVAESASAMKSASQSVQSRRPMSETDVQRLIASDSALVDALASLRDLRMRGDLIDHTLAVTSSNLRAFIGDHHLGVADQLLASVATIRSQNEHDLAILGYAIDQLEATQARTTQLFERSRYIIDAARESTGAIQGALFAAVGIALTVVQVLALPNVKVPNALNRETPLVIVSSGAVAFILGIVLSRHAIGQRRLFWGAIVGGLACPLAVVAARLAL